MFTFNAYGNTLVVTAEDISKARAYAIEDGLTDLSTAFGIANKKMLWSNSESKDGIWDGMYFDNDSKVFEWKEGYFFN